MVNRIIDQSKLNELMSDGWSYRIYSGSGGGNGGDNTLFGKEVISGSITLEEDTTSEVTLIEDVRNVFGSTRIHAFCFRERTSRENNGGLWGSCYQSIRYGKQQTGASSAFYYDNGNSTAGKYLGISLSASKLAIRFNSSCVGYAGDTYRWFAFSEE